MSQNLPSPLPTGAQLIESDFYGDRLTVVIVDGDAYVPLRPITENLGLAWRGQLARTNRDPVFEEQIKKIKMKAADGKQRDMLCLALEQLPGWLTGIQPARVREELREKLHLYRKRAFSVLWDSVKRGELTFDDAFENQLQGDSLAVQAYRLAEAQLLLARQQVLQEARLNQHESELNSHRTRLDMLEAKLGNDRFVTADQASQISQAVKTIAHVLGKRSGRNEYGGVYGELYRRFGITSYKQLPAAKFDEAINFLNQWLQSMTDDEAAF